VGKAPGSPYHNVVGGGSSHHGKSKTSEGVKDIYVLSGRGFSAFLKNFSNFFKI
jgi:hypothetical protein